jgi:hydroxyethylthiazole kinase
MCSVRSLPVESDRIVTNFLTELRAKAPLVQCITNYVAMNIAANTLLAAGASPAMIHTAEETEDFAKIAGGLTVNIGTISPPWLEGMRRAIEAAASAGVPWVLDPVAHFATPYRSAAAHELIQMRPTILRGNASEIIGLGGGQSEAKGVDAKDPVAAAEEVGVQIAKEIGCVVAITSDVDFVTDGTRIARIGGGSPIMPLVTAMGCSLTCLIGAFAAVAQPMEATVSALTLFAEAGDRAAGIANGPGSFTPQFIDQLHAITPEEFAATSWVTWET